MPGIDQCPVHRRLPAHRFEACPVEKGLAQRMTDQRLIQTRDGGGGLGERRGGCHLAVGVARGPSHQPIEPANLRHRQRPIHASSA